MSRPKVTVRREIEAPAEELFDDWLNADSLGEWMRPPGMTGCTATVDPRVGGAFEIVMHGPQGTLRHTGVYKTIDRPRRLVFTWVSAATHHEDSLVTVELRPTPTGTEVVVTHEHLPDADAAPSHIEGWTAALELLAEKLERKGD